MSSNTDTVPAPYSMTCEQAVEWLRSQPDQEFLVKACYFDDPLMSAVERYATGGEWQAVSKIVPQKAGKALDVGAGRGLSTYALAKMGWKVTALEPDPSELIGAGAIKQIAQASGYDINIVTEYGSDLPFGTGLFDLVYGRQVLHHLPDLKHFAREVFRILKPGGMFVATREHVLTLKSDLQAFLDSHPLHKFHGAENAFLLEEYLGAIREAGFTVTQVMGPFDSAVNYFPVSEEELDRQRQWILGRKYGAAIANLLLSNPLLSNYGRKLGSRLLTANDNTPGRLYSFVAVKRGGDVSPTALF